MNLIANRTKILMVKHGALKAMIGDPCIMKWKLLLIAQMCNEEEGDYLWVNKCWESVVKSRVMLHDDAK